MREIFAHGVGFSTLASDYASHGVELVENTPEEIRDVVIEMVERLDGTWQCHEEDEQLQRRFWEIFQTDAINTPQGWLWHGKIIRARFGSSFLRNNHTWLQ